MGGKFTQGLEDISEIGVAITAANGRAHRE